MHTIQEKELDMAMTFTGCAAYIYDETGEVLIKTVVAAHDEENDTIKIDEANELSYMSTYVLLILTEPSPHAFSCILELTADGAVLKLSDGEEREQRKSVRYPVSGRVIIDSYLDEGKTYKLHTAQEARLVNISTGGLRLKMKPNSLTVDDLVQIAIQTHAEPRILTAHVVNLLNADESSEYGCKLVQVLLI